MKVGKLVGGLLLIGLVWVLFLFGLGFSAFTPILIFFGILLIVTSYERKPSTTSETQPIREVIREKEIIREIVKIPCSHCGTLVLQEATKCPNCGAPLRR